MLEKHYTTQMSNDKEKLKTRLENIQRQPKKKHKAAGLLVFLALAAALTVGTICLASTTAEDVTMTDEEFAVFLNQSWAPSIPSPVYADQEILVFYAEKALLVLDLNTRSFRYIFDFSELNLTHSTNRAAGSAYLQLDAARDGSKVYLSAGGPKDLASKYDTYVVDLTTGQVKKGKLPRGTQLYQGQQKTFERFPDLDGSETLISAYCVPVEDRTYYLGAGSDQIRDLLLVTRYDDDVPAKVWYLFGEPDILLEDPTQDLYAAVEAHLAQEFHRIFDPYYDIQSLTISEWAQDGDTATFLYTMGHLKDGQPMSYDVFSLKVSREGNQLTFYRDSGGWGGGAYDGPNWVAMDLQSFVLLP